MLYEDLKNEVYKAMENKPDWSRKGQFVFNYIEEKYGNVARIVQFEHGIDCFYDNSCINEFIAKCCEVINEYELG